jgi:hypothetical protein
LWLVITIRNKEYENEKVQKIAVIFLFVWSSCL